MEREENARRLRSDPKPTSEARKGSRKEFGWLAVGKVTFSVESQPKSFMDPAQRKRCALLLVRGDDASQPAKVRLRLACEPALRMTHRNVGRVLDVTR